jgi:hypothetical protein
MQNLKAFTAALLISVLFIAGITADTTQVGEIIIKDARKKGEPGANLAAHKPYDVEVYRILFMGEGYRIRYYHIENNALTSHEAMYIATDVFDKASYKWTSDTSVAIKLFNSKSKREKKFTVFGYGSTSGMSDY